jgi:hypothetical protein
MKIETRFQVIINGNGDAAYIFDNELRQQVLTYQSLIDAEIDAAIMNCEAAFATYRAAKEQRKGRANTACTCDSTLVTDTSNHQLHCERRSH